MLLCHWPAYWVTTVPGRTDLFARGAYTVEMFETADELSEATTILIAALARSGEVALTALAGESIGTIGRA